MYNEPKFTRLTIEQSDKKVVWEVPYEDVSASDMMEAINTLMIGITFTPETVLHAMAGYLEECGSDLYDSYEHVESELVGDTLDDEGD